MPCSGLRWPLERKTRVRGSDGGKCWIRPTLHTTVRPGVILFRLLFGLLPDRILSRSIPSPPLSLSPREECPKTRWPRAVATWRQAMAMARACRPLVSFSLSISLFVFFSLLSYWLFLGWFDFVWI